MKAFLLKVQEELTLAKTIIAALVFLGPFFTGQNLSGFISWVDNVWNLNQRLEDMANENEMDAFEARMYKWILPRLEKDIIMQKNLIATLSSITTVSEDSQIALDAAYSVLAEKTIELDMLTKRLEHINEEMETRATNVED